MATKVAEANRGGRPRIWRGASSKYQVNLPDFLRRRMESVAAAEGSDESEIVRRALELHLFSPVELVALERGGYRLASADDSN